MMRLVGILCSRQRVTPPPLWSRGSVSGRLLAAGRRDGRGCVFDDERAPLASCSYQPGIAFVIAGCTPFGDGGVVVEPQVPGGEPAQAFAMFEFHEPGFIQ